MELHMINKPITGHCRKHPTHRKMTAIKLRKLTATKLRKQ